MNTPTECLNCLGTQIATQQLNFPITVAGETYDRKNYLIYCTGCGMGFLYSPHDGKATDKEAAENWNTHMAFLERGMYR